VSYDQWAEVSVTFQESYCWWSYKRPLFVFRRWYLSCSMAICKWQRTQVSSQGVKAGRWQLVWVDCVVLGSISACLSLLWLLQIPHADSEGHDNMLTGGLRRWGDCVLSQCARANYCAATQWSVSLLVLQGLCGPPLALDKLLRCVRVAVWGGWLLMGAIVILSLGIWASRNDDGCSVWLGNEQVSRAPGCFRGGGCCGRGWSWPVWCLLSALFLGFSLFR